MTSARPALPARSGESTPDRRAGPAISPGGSHGLSFGMPIACRAVAVLAVALALMPVPASARGPEVPPELPTRAEASSFRATSTYAEALDFLRQLEARSPYLRSTSSGPRSRADRCRLSSCRSSGKDALLLLRDLVQGLQPEVLDRITLLVVPLYNVDGHERVSRFNRANQDGPEAGMGFRTNARGLDLNRDHLGLLPVYRVMKPLPRP